MTKQRSELEESLADLAKAGLVLLPKEGVARTYRMPIEVPGKPLSEIVIEDRGEEVFEARSALDCESSTLAFTRRQLNDDSNDGAK